MKFTLPWGGNRSVAQIVAGLSDMVAELDKKTEDCCGQIEKCDNDTHTEAASHAANVQAEKERHDVQVGKIAVIQTNLVNERKSAETIAANLKGILGL